jgi:hypothetical protein
MKIMKKRLFSSLFLGAICGVVSAQTLTVADVEVLEGGIARYSLKVDVQGGTYTGVQFNISFGESGLFSIPEIKKEDSEAEKAQKTPTALSTWGGGTVLSGQLNSSGSGKVSCYSAQGLPIPDGGVILATIPFTTTATKGDECTVNITDVVFMTEDTRKKAEDTSFTIKVVDRLTIDENAESDPTATSGKVNVHVARTIKANQWSTICLPISLNLAKAQAAFGTDVVVGEFDGFVVEYASDEDVTPDAIILNFKKVNLTAKSGIAAGKPYIIKTSGDIDGFDVDEVTISNEISKVEKEDVFNTKGSFVGTFTKATVPEDALFISGNKFWYSTGTRETKGLRGWFALGAVLDKETDFGSRVIINFIDDEATGITTAKTFNGEQIYTLSGQRVSKAGKGVYIVNGKKVIKK